MFQHIGVLTLVESATDEQRDALAQALRDLVGQVPGLSGAKVLTDAGIRDGNADVLFAMTFDDQDSWAAYGAHPAHVAVVETHVKPVLAAKVFIQTTGPDFLA
ncbi:Dabb family protein [Nocardioides gilvus]|uniref:Dabb family protein n=1 Tax=Nocardioides gilvus TaxID=1735589 RepID=UPI000D740D29|nr:Dabb family protein [Nocardioides gilvus]